MHGVPIPAPIMTVTDIVICLAVLVNTEQCMTSWMGQIVKVKGVGIIRFVANTSRISGTQTICVFISVSTIKVSLAPFSCMTAVLGSK